MFDEDDNIHRACFSGSAKEIEKCLRAGEDINRHNEHGLSPLHLAVQRERDDVVAVVEFLLHHDANVNDSSMVEHDTPLHLTLQYCDAARVEAVAEKLVENDAELQVTNRRLRRPYDLAIDRGFTELAELLASDLPPKVAIGEFRNQRAKHYGRKLIEAVIEGDIEDIHQCIRRKADVNFINENGSGAIHHMATHCPMPLKLEVLQILKDSGVDKDLLNQENDTALNLVIKTPTLRENDLMRLLTEKLLTWGADHTLKDIDKKDAWILADERKYEDIKRLLRGRNAAFPERPTQEDAPAEPIKELPNLHFKLFQAILVGKLKDVQEALKMEGVNVNTRNKDGMCPIHLAVMRLDESDKEAIIHLLHGSDASMNSLTKEDRQTALHLAVLRNDLLAAEVLVELDVDINVKNKEGLDAHSLAIKLSHQDIADIIAKKIPPNQKTKTCAIS